MRKAGGKVYILGTGNQAPYGIGEIIAVIPAAHVRKIAAVLKQWYNPPALRLNSKQGQRMELDWGYDGKTPELRAKNG